MRTGLCFAVGLLCLSAACSAVPDSSARADAGKPLAYASGDASTSDPMSDAMAPADCSADAQPADENDAASEGGTGAGDASPGSFTPGLQYSGAIGFVRGGS